MPRPTDDDTTNKTTATGETVRRGRTNAFRQIHLATSGRPRPRLVVRAAAGWTRLSGRAVAAEITRHARDIKVVRADVVARRRHTRRLFNGVDEKNNSGSAAWTRRAVIGPSGRQVADNSRPRLTKIAHAKSRQVPETTATA